MCLDTARSHINLLPRSAETSTEPLLHKTQNEVKQNLHNNRTFAKKKWQIKFIIKLALPWIFNFLTSDWRWINVWGFPQLRITTFVGRSFPHVAGPFQAHDHAAVPWIQQQAVRTLIEHRRHRCDLSSPRWTFLLVSHIHNWKGYIGDVERGRCFRASLFNLWGASNPGIFGNYASCMYNWAMGTKTLAMILHSELEPSQNWRFARNRQINMVLLIDQNGPTILWVTKMSRWFIASGYKSSNSPMEKHVLRSLFERLYFIIFGFDHDSCFGSKGNVDFTFLVLSYNHTVWHFLGSLILNYAKERSSLLSIHNFRAFINGTAEEVDSADQWKM